MKPRHTKTAFIYAVTRGHVQLSRVTQRFSTNPLSMSQIDAGSVGANSVGVVNTQLNTGEGMQMMQIGRNGSCICEKCINLENATMPKSFSDRTTFGSI